MDKTELQEIVISVLAISFAFTLIQPRLGVRDIPSPGFWVFFAITIVTVGLGFVLHELGHRFMARKYGAYAVYRAWPTGLMFMLALAIIDAGFLFAAPGAVYIYSQYISRKENGIISVVGPLMNLALALFFAFIILLLPSSGGALITMVSAALVIGFRVNVFLALFNMIPIFPLDGSKVFAWDKALWASIVVACLFLMWFAPVSMPGGSLALGS